MNVWKTNGIRCVPKKPTNQNILLSNILFCWGKVYCLKCENYQISSPSSKIALRHTGLVLLLSCWKRKFPISFLRLSLWPPNSPDLNPVDYKIWSLVQERVYQQPISNIDELRERSVAVWEAVDQCVIDAAIRQWRERLLACVKAKGGHFEHLLK